LNSKKVRPIKIIPSLDRILIKRASEEEKTKRGIIDPAKRPVSPFRMPRALLGFFSPPMW
jgi:hypothetical protein